MLIHVTQMSHRSTCVCVTPATRCKPSSLQVEEVDEGLLRFQQLEELILSANHISRVNSAHLPRTLKVSEQGLVQDGAAIPMWEHSGSQTAGGSARTVHFQGVCCSFCPGQVLELCYNAVGDLQDLCAWPPPQLQHLGLGYNRLCGPSQEKHLTVDFW